MGRIKINYTHQFIDDLADLVYFIEYKSSSKLAKKYIDKVYTFIENINFDLVIFPLCKDPQRAELGMKCIAFNKKYTIVFYQFSNEIIITDFIPSKMIIY